MAKKQKRSREDFDASSARFFADEAQHAFARVYADVRRMRFGFRGVEAATASREVGACLTTAQHVDDVTIISGGGRATLPRASPRICVAGEPGALR